MYPVLKVDKTGLESIIFGKGRPNLSDHLTNNGHGGDHVTRSGHENGIEGTNEDLASDDEF